MRSKKVEFRMPWALHALIEHEAKARGFRNLARYFIGISTADIFAARRLKWLRDFSNLDPKTQDFILDEVIHITGEIPEVLAVAKFLRERRMAISGGGKSLKLPKTLRKL